MGDDESKELVTAARAGDRHAFEALVTSVQGRIYNLAMRMLGDPAEAHDATQEILIKVVTRLDSFRGESAFSTWVYRVAANHLLNERERGLERRKLTFEAIEGMVTDGLERPHELPITPDHALLVEEAKLTCTHGMLVCLDREHRLAFILGHILEVSGDEGAAILEIDPAAYRKRLSRARERIEAFMQGTCGLVNPQRPCRCSKQAGPLARLGVIDPARPRFATHPARPQVKAIGSLLSSAAVFRSHPDYQVADTFVAKIRELLDQATGGELRN